MCKLVKEKIKWDFYLFYLTTKLKMLFCGGISYSKLREKEKKDE
jgi:hypothetical protein